VIAFDVMRYLYTSASLNSMYYLYPDRNILLITGENLALSLTHTPDPSSAGDSTQSIPRSAPFFKSQCNLIFIDGGHTHEVAYADLLNMRDLANETFHTVVIDDGLDEEVRSAATEAISRGFFRATKEVLTNQTLCLRSRQVSAGADMGKVEVYRDPICPHGIEADSVQDSLIIGKYIF
jgi:hypothetical protein